MLQQTTSLQSHPSDKNNRLEDIKALGIVENYLVLSEIGENHLYPVFLAFPLDSTSTSLSSLVVLKAIPVNDKKGSFVNECGVFQLKPHRNILKCIEIIQNVKLNFGDYKRDEYHLFVLPYLSNGDLLDFLRKTRFDERTARFYFEQILDSVEHMHSQGLAHRDLKAENFLIGDDFEMVLADFGHSVKFADVLFSGSDAITSPGICPPEYYNGAGYKATEMDVFALGKLLLILVTGLNPFKTTKATDQTFSLIANGNWQKYWSLTNGWMKKKWTRSEEFSSKFKELVEQMLNPNPKLRPTIQQIRESAWFTEIKPKSYEEVQATMVRSRMSL
eukprot:CAMPEP_0176433544 /NCGR_PEP_ID=MMETSP0127-20121128/16095_1 /TAXON_ID=938130 /ORGANISM="Platyophrya macrostoma, Strain WH" /LENGTH=331 /DNA_ID=CAMNT_0017816011 /DNA_START=31 /DNA_END=1026 /DNA_ORIENTATION=-